MASVGAVHYYGQGYAVVVVERYFPPVAVAKVLKDDFLGVERFAVVAAFLGGRGVECSGEDHREYRQYFCEQFHVRAWRGVYC